MKLVIKNFSKTYPNGVQALRNVNLTINKGMFGLLGPNGAGKSTLMRTLATLQDVDEGEATLGDIDILKNKSEIRKILGYLPQDFGVYPRVTAKEMLLHYAALKGISGSKNRKKLVDDLLHQVNLFEFRNKRLSSFSGGMKRRFGIAQAFIGDPKMIIVDEPTAGLDPAERVRFNNLLSEISENIIVILSTHIVDDINELCKQMAILNKGKLLTSGNPSELKNSLDGKIWKKAITKKELPEYQKEHQVIFTKLEESTPVIHVYNKQKPNETFQYKKPDLQDVYFYSVNSPYASL
ncbi:ABC transporter ATP-binding protein [Polaribacter porphyrae]|uniref:Multidrug ABC transporter ATP-binding protein n=1 Tax=Polaribacter porphyrae TaxID=1137780 RepID=A0A2S7WNU8_9FLAO|nr:ABC transporter ATP-binding protein [Polaribacter porphyrae]PQJ79263.1 multidrug ABC transporter ATP-binding protein [Polaribacter porphyrae]